MILVNWNSKTWLVLEGRKPAQWKVAYQKLFSMLCIIGHIKFTKGIGYRNAGPQRKKCQMFNNY